MLLYSCVQENLTVWLKTFIYKSMEKVCWISTFSLYRAKFPFNHNGLILPAIHAWDIPQVGLSHIAMILEYSHAKFKFPLDKFFTFVLRI